MLRPTFIALLPLLAASASSLSPSQVCSSLAVTLGAGIVYLAGTSQYVDQTTSKATESAEMSPACVVEPQTSSQVSTIIQLIGANRTPFAIRNGGHQYNPGFSSTNGVQISMVKFNQTTINQAAGTIDVDAGLRWIDVYNYLNGTGLGLNGARISGPGVTGVTVGGGYAWTSQEQGLTIDKVVSAEVVLPSGSIVTASATSNTDLFWAIRGGMNKFGIITKWKFSSYAQGLVSGGSVTYGGDGNTTLLNLVVNAFDAWQSNHTDPKAQIDFAYIHPAGGNPVLSLNAFYNGPKTPPGTFDVLFNVPNIVNTYQEGIPFNSFLNVKLGVIPASTRSISSTVPVTTYPAKYFKKLMAAADALINSGRSIEVVIMRAEPFLPSFYSHATTDSAYPHSTSDPVTPCSIIANWGSAADDDFFNAKVGLTTLGLYGEAILEGLSTINSPFYPNYASFLTPAVFLYRKNLARLESIRDTVDPNRVMDLTGGFDI